MICLLIWDNVEDFSLMYHLPLTTEGESTFSYQPPADSKLLIGLKGSIPYRPEVTVDSNLEGQRAVVKESQKPAAPPHRITRDSTCLEPMRGPSLTLGVRTSLIKMQRDLQIAF
jgi:hypothetical protein